MRTKQTKPDPDKINIVTLGCAKNIVDSEVLLTQLRASKFDVSHESRQGNAGTVVINTCGFIDRAKEQSIQTIVDFLELKKEGAIKRVFVTGCLSQRYKPELMRDLPDVDGYFGTHDLPDLLKTLGADYRKELLGDRITVTEGHYAYLKVSEGCDRGCSFCAIPLMRGKHVSRSIDFLVDEAEHLVKRGVKEIMLIAQDLTFYGLDLYKERRLNELLLRLSDVEGLEWIRLHYAYPSHFPLDILPTIRDRSNICKYLDMPIQHASDAMLKRMRRATSRAKLTDLIKRIRDEVPGVAIRSTLLVGHPGETEREHEELLDFLKETRLERVGAFIYSHEENTHSYTFDDDVPAEVKEQRLDQVMLLQQNISLELNKARIGQVMKTIIDREEGTVAIGRTEFDSPDIDNEVIVESPGLEVGEFYDVTITDGEEYDLVGKVG
ncbi:MAG: 30S ribosomal protein S12 methylthiotransferase RimO [Verrucomicrobia bacterium]|nr:30S ribosomal protein S12 methylthiotransferase RimO [Verrucomicrobiota bacterium]